MKNSAMIETLKIASNHIKDLGEQAEEQMLGINEDDVTDTVHLAFYQIADLLEQAANQKRSRLFKELETFTAGKSLALHKLEAIQLAKCAIFLMVDKLDYKLSVACEKVSQYMGASDGFMRDKMPPKSALADYRNTDEYSHIQRKTNSAPQTYDDDDKITVIKKTIQDFAYEAKIKYEISTNGYLSDRSFELTLGNIDQNAELFFDGLD